VVVAFGVTVRVIGIRIAEGIPGIIEKGIVKEGIVVGLRVGFGLRPKVVRLYADNGIAIVHLIQFPLLDTLKATHYRNSSTCSVDAGVQEVIDISNKAPFTTVIFPWLATFVELAGDNFKPRGLR